ncbi:uncharacterized protein LOC144870621 [Branchiostoma floridae x Branchiostoma japonicum]
MEAQKTATLVHLKGWALPAKDLRVLHFHRAQQTFSTDPEASDQAVPLFLGADVLAGSGIACDNQPRIHARYAKKGLATKLHFEAGVKLAGIHGTCKGVWFYSIQGVFRAVFELHNRQSQLECLTVLQELWRLRFDDDLLQESYHIKQDTEIEETGHRPARNPSQHVASIKKQSLATYSVAQSDFKQTAMAATFQQNTMQSCRLKGHGKASQTNALKQAAHPQLQIGPNEAKQDYSADANDTESRNDDSITDHNYSSSHPDDVLCQIIRTLDNLAEQQQLDVFLRRCIELLTSLVSILKDTGSMGLPLDLLGSFVTNVRQLTEDQLQDESHMRQTSMVVVSEWLGQQFQMSNKDIVGRVEDFKKRHIMCVDNLPPAEEIIDELFPPAMKTLFLTWMASSSGNKESGGGSDRLMFDSSQFPVLQLILEFANHTLISGVAHVLYSRLIHS